MSGIQPLVLALKRIVRVSHVQFAGRVVDHSDEIVYISVSPRSSFGQLNLRVLSLLYSIIYDVWTQIFGKIRKELSDSTQYMVDSQKRISTFESR